MIVDFSVEFVKKISKRDLCELLQSINKNYHYILKDQEVYNIIKSKIQENKCQIINNTFKTFVGRSGFNPSNELKQFLTVINVDKDFDIENLKTLLSNPGYLICENCNYEWWVYLHFCSIYAKDRKNNEFPNKYSNIIAFLLSAMKENRLIGLGSGGDGQIMPSYNFLKETIWKRNLHLQKKCCFLFDRDTDDDQTLSRDHKNLFKFLNEGKDHTNTTDVDIYCLNQPTFIWHMWYKRAIENYISDDCYRSNNVDTSNLENAPNRDYYSICPTNCSRYEKKNIGTIARLMDYRWLEQNTKRFNCNGNNMSEIQLFLLKLVKII